MPYLEKAKRMTVSVPHMENTGALNYVLTKIALGYLHMHGLSYKTCNDILGAMDGARQEFYRRVVAPYEDKKIAENGDVYPQEGDYDGT